MDGQRQKCQDRETNRLFYSHADRYKEMAHRQLKANKQMIKEEYKIDKGAWELENSWSGIMFYLWDMHSRQVNSKCPAPHPAVTMSFPPVWTTLIEGAHTSPSCHHMDGRLIATDFNTSSLPCPSHKALPLRISGHFWTRESVNAALS